MIKKHPKTFNEHLDRKYGKPDSPEREAFIERSQAYMIAEMVKEARRKANLTQQELADRLQVNRAYISKIERAISDIRLSTLKKIIEEGIGGKLSIKVEF
jgi:HTH-type transcriptional regulator / antitoxin HipB